jgi:hypothetical protein
LGTRGTARCSNRHRHTPLNAGADLLILYHPVAARTVKRKIGEMMRVEAA